MSVISTAALDAIGFRDGLAVEATFHSVNVYFLQGIQCSQATLEHAAGTTRSGINYQLAIGFSVNDASKRLFGDTLVDDELKWAEQHACTGPYLLVEVEASPAKRVGRVKDEGASITTYNMFSSEKMALSAMEDDVLPQAVSAVSDLLRAAGNQCAARHVVREVFGLTSDSRRPVHDIRFSMSGTLSVSRIVNEETIRYALKEAPMLAPRLDPNVAKFLHLGTDEADPLRKFLFFFLAVEIETHRTFADIDHATKVACVLDASLHNNEIATVFLQAQPERLKTLKDRFIWCAMFAWPGMTTVDLGEFAQLKSVRDKLSHGEITAPPSSAVASIEALALKLQRYRVPAEVARRISQS
jgi:hypothetical protein